jgi:uncharacterized protein YndB with AHSA1/START domain
MARSDQVVSTEDEELVVTRLFAAPRELVFAAYSSCEHLSNWWGPRAWPMRECSMEFREGGVWDYCLRGPNEGDESWGRAVFNEIVAPERIIYTDAFSDADGNVNAGMPQTRSLIEFAVVDGGTRVTIRATYSTAEALRQVLDMGMVQGLSETLDRLDEHLEMRLGAGAGA